MPGIPELLVILLIVLLIFGAGKLPAIGGALGKSIKNFKGSMKSGDEVEVKERTQIATKERAELEAAKVEDSELEDAELEAAESKRKKG